MDMISQLPDELLLRILSRLPTTNVVATMVLSKRWKFLWMFVPRLVYDDSYWHGRSSQFVDRSLIFHKAPILETLRFINLGRAYGSGDLHVWIRAADKCCVRELIIHVSSTCEYPVVLPRSLFSEGCRKVVTLKLSNAILVDVSSPISFPSLKNLSLISMKYPGDEFVNRLLSSCPVLEDLIVEQSPYDNVTIFTVRVPSLKRLSMCKLPKRYIDDADGYVIDAPSLEFMAITVQRGGLCVIENDMPNIVQAYIDVTSSLPRMILSFVTSVKRLYILCLPTAKDAYPVGSIFLCLLHLKICTCETEWSNLLMRVLEDSPHLRVLKLEQYHHRRASQPRPYWSEPSSVPLYMVSSLETVEWVDYEGTKEEKEVAAYILRNGSFLDEVTIKPKSTSHYEKLEMIKELSLSPRSSPTCRLYFD